MKLSVDTKAITFDVGGTLIEPWPSVGQIYAEAASRHGYPNISAELLKQRFIAAWHEMKDFNYARAEWASLVDATFRGLIENLPSETFFPELYEQFGRPDVWRVFPDVLPVVETLAARGLKLGIISNWDERLRPLLRELQLHKYFDPVVISCEIGCCKPERRIFEAAADKLGVPVSNILHVGDNVSNDRDGALNAGFQACLLIRGPQGPDAAPIHSLHDLVPQHRPSFL